MATIAVIAAGEMGSAVGRRLVQGGCSVLTNLDGRSSKSRSRAEEAGLKDVPLSQIANQASFVLSIVPPSSAFSFAELFLRESKSANRNGSPLVFVDCNAVNPATVKRIAGKYQVQAYMLISSTLTLGSLVFPVVACYQVCRQWDYWWPSQGRL